MIKIDYYCYCYYLPLIASIFLFSAKLNHFRDTFGTLTIKLEIKQKLVVLLCTFNQKRKRSLQLEGNPKGNGKGELGTFMGFVT